MDIRYQDAGSGGRIETRIIEDVQSHIESFVEQRYHEHRAGEGR